MSWLAICACAVLALWALEAVAFLVTYLDQRDHQNNATAGGAEFPPATTQTDEANK